jgi:hypothetical protein
VRIGVGRNRQVALADELADPGPGHAAQVQQRDPAVAKVVWREGRGSAMAQRCYLLSVTTSGPVASTYSYCFYDRKVVDGDGYCQAWRDPDAKKRHNVWLSSNPQPARWSGPVASNRITLRICGEARPPPVSRVFELSRLCKPEVTTGNGGFL